MSAPKTPLGDTQPEMYADAHPRITDRLRVTLVEADADLPGFETRAGYAFEVVGKRGGVKAAVWLSGDAIRGLRAQIDKCVASEGYVGDCTEGTGK